MRLVYIAGKFRAATPWGVEQNVRAAEIAALDVWKAGAVAVCPHTMTRYFDQELPDEVFLQGTLTLLRVCNVVLMLPGWHQSAGARLELQEAGRLGLPVCHTLDQLVDWLGAN